MDSVHSTEHHSIRFIQTHTRTAYAVTLILVYALKYQHFKTCGTNMLIEPTNVLLKLVQLNSNFAKSKLK